MLVKSLLFLSCFFPFFFSLSLRCRRQKRFFFVLVFLSIARWLGGCCISGWNERGKENLFLFVLVFSRLAFALRRSEATEEVFFVLVFFLIARWWGWCFFGCVARGK